MRHGFIALVTAAIMIPAANARADVVLPSLQWQYRVVVSFTDGEPKPTDLIQTFRQTSGVAERQIAWFVVGPDRIASNLDAAEVPARARLEKLHDISGFQTVLVGKDGGVKARQNDKLNLQALFEAIDRMPMRRREMRNEPQ